MSRVIEVGNPRGLIAIYCDETEAWDIASKYPYPDTFGRELADAIAKAYPEPSDDEPQPGIRISVSSRRTRTGDGGTG